MAQIRDAGAPQREAVAWFIAGGDPAGWLAEVARWPVPTEAVQFVVLTTRPGGDAAGVLAIPPPGIPVDAARGGGAVAAYGEIAPRCYAPVEARLVPPLDQSELRAATHFACQVWHPALGLTGVEAHEIVHAAHGLAAPPLLAEDWSGARSGVSRAWGLRSVRRQMEISLADVFGEESRDIGSQSDQPPPPAPDEPRTGKLGQVMLGGAALVGQAVLGLTGLLPRTARAPTWVNALEDWLQRRMQGVSEQMEQERHRELHRLLKLLERDPDEGLRHAISLAALLSRGRAPASGQLGRRGPLDFNLRRLGGGGPADAWAVPDDLRSSLAKSYREQAMRELKLGRHRRAACILAELLGDLAGAANALKQGRHFVEASVLYRDRLNQPRAAAECLAEDGLLHEAVALFEKQGCWLEAADVYARLGDTAAEHAALRRVVADHHERGDILAAARLLEERLGAVEEAAHLLASAWPGGRQALACLEARLALHERHGHAAERDKLLQVLGTDAVPEKHLAGVAGIAAKVAEHAADARVRRQAAEVVRMQAARGLGARRLGEAAELAVLRALMRLAPGDRLLARDAVRFRAERQVAKPVRPPWSPRPPAAGPVPTFGLIDGGTVQLPQMKRVKRATGDAHQFCAFGEAVQGGWMVTCGRWSGQFSSVRWPEAKSGWSLPTVFAPGHDCVVAAPLAEALPMKVFPAGETSGPALQAGTPSWWPGDVVAADWSQSSAWLARVVDGRVVLACHHAGALTGSHDVTDELAAAGAMGGGTALSLSAAGGYGRVALGYGMHLLVLENQREVRVLPLGQRVTGLVPVQGQAPGWVVLLERGAVFAPADGRPAWTLDDDLETPRAVVLRSGEVVVAGEETGWLWRLGEARAERLGRLALPGGAGVALLPTSDEGGFAVCLGDANVRRWRIKPG